MTVLERPERRQQDFGGLRLHDVVTGRARFGVYKGDQASHLGARVAGTPAPQRKRGVHEGFAVKGLPAWVGRRVLGRRREPHVEQRDVRRHGDREGELRPAVPPGGE